MLKQTLTKKTIAEAMEVKYDLHPRTAYRFVSSFFDCIIKNLKEGNSIRLKNFTNLVVKYKKGGRPVRNITTGEELPMHDLVTVTNGHKDEDAVMINTSDLITAMQKEYSKMDACLARSLVNSIIDEMRRSTDLAYRVEIRGLGTFSSKLMPPRKSRNPKTGEEFIRGEKISKTYKVSKSLRRELTETLV